MLMHMAYNHNYHFESSKHRSINSNGNFTPLTIKLIRLHTSRLHKDKILEYFNQGLIEDFNPQIMKYME